MPNDDLKLVAEYSASRSEIAFTTLVERYTNFVYSAALRQVRDPHQAEEVTQAVFVILARKAGKLSPRTLLAGWLYRTTHYVSLSIIRRETRRRQLEQEAYMESVTQNLPDNSHWECLSPILDEAMLRLRDKERDALLLRYFENKNLREVGAALGVEERAAQKRVLRGLERLRAFFAKRGVVLSTATIVGIVSANSIQAAPMGLTVSITTAAAAKGVAASSSTLTLIKGALKIMAWTKAKTAIVVGVAAILTAGTATVVVKTVTAERTLTTNPSWADDPQAWQTDSRTLEKNPPVFILRPTRFPNGGGGISLGGPNGTKIMSKRIDIKSLLVNAYQINSSRMILPNNLPNESYDLMLTLREKPIETLQQELKHRYGLAAHLETRETDVFYLQVKTPNAPGLKVAGASKDGGGGSSWSSSMNEMTIKGQSLTGFAGSLESRFGKPLIDRTGLDGLYDIHIKWKLRPGESDKDTYEQAMQEQLGLELVPGRESVEMLVVERTK